MIYTDMTKKAMKLAYKAHEGQEDKSGIPYVFHPLYVAERMEDELSATVALLHDVLEDTSVTLGDLEAEGFPEEALTALKLLTRANAPYLDYIRKLKDNPVARKVKLVDLAHNSDVSRLDRVTKADRERLELYAEAVKILSKS